MARAVGTQTTTTLTTMDPTKKPAFSILLSSAEDGRLIDELNDRMRDLVQTMRQEQNARGGKPKGSINLSFALSLDQHGLMEVTAAVTTKEPKAERHRSIFYTLSDNTLSPNNPKQITMDLDRPRADETARDIKLA